MEDKSMSTPEQIQLVRYKVAKVPTMYMKRNELPTCAGTTMKVVSQLIDDPQGFADLGRIVYFYSTFEENALLAASNIVKSAINNKVSAFMLPFNQYMEEVKTFESSSLIKGLQDAAISCLYFLGCEYKHATSGFTESHLDSFIKARRIAGKSTIMSSHLTPAEFAERYGMNLERFGVVTMKFDDEGIMPTIGQLAKEMEAVKARRAK